VHRPSSTPYLVSPTLRWFAALALGVPTVAAAAPTLAVVGVHQAELSIEQQEQAVAQLVASIDTSGKADAWTLAELHTAISGREEVALREGLLGEGRRQFAEARNAYNQASWADAADGFRGAISALERSIPGSNTTRELWEAYVYLGASQLQSEAGADASASFQAALALAPGRQPDAALFPPDVTQAYDAARRLLEPAATTLTVGGDPGAAATVYLDGEARGTAPATLTGVLPGKHYVNLRASSGTAFAEVYIPPMESGAAPAPVQVDIPLGAPSLGAAEDTAGARGRQNAAFYRALGQQARADYVLVAGVDGSTLSLQLYARGTDTFSKVTEVPVTGTADDEAVAAVPLLLNAIGPDGNLPAANTSPTSGSFLIGTNPVVAKLLLQPETYAPASTAGDGGPSAGPSKGLLIGGIVGGAVVVGGAVAVTAVLLGGDAEPEPAQGTVTVGPF
jgi:hypothetical protein